MKEAIEAVKRACECSQKLQNELNASDTFIKEDRSPVTVADYCSQAIISYYLSKHFPKISLVAEESASPPEGFEERIAEFVPQHALSYCRQEPTSSVFWVLDPIDGTKGFLRGDHYAISLALIENGEVVFGVLGCPQFGAGGSLFIAEKGKGATVQALDSEKTSKLKVSNKKQIAQAIICESVESGHSSHSKSEQLRHKLRITEPPLRIDSQTKYGAVSQGIADIYLRLPTRADYEEKIWDHAAGALVVIEAGGTVTDITGKPLDFSAGATLKKNRGILATNGILHSELLTYLGVNPII